MFKALHLGFTNLHFINEDKLTATQSPPAHPHIFEPGLISWGIYETHSAFLPSGDTLFFLMCSDAIS